MNNLPYLLIPLGLIALVLALAPTPTHAGCGACGGGAAHEHPAPAKAAAACPPGCDKPCCAAAADSAAPVAWKTDFDGALAEAKKSGKAVLADFAGSDWCGWCIKLDKEVFSKSEFGKFADEHLVLFLADFPRGKEQDEKTRSQNRALQGKFSIEGFPTVLLLDGDGKEIARTGYRKGGPAAYVDHLKTLLKK